MDVPSTWCEKRRIESFEVDRFGGVRPQALFGLLLNGAWNATHGSVYGYEELSARNLMWVLAKVQLRILSTPRWRDEITLQTWVKRVERFYVLRDFVVSSTTGRKMISATTAWIMIDKPRGRPQRLDPASDGFPWDPSREELETNVEKLPPVDGAQEAARFAVRFSDIDVNQHVNAARYLQWMIDSQPPRVLEDREPGEIQISFLAEALEGDQVVVRTAGGAGDGENDENAEPLRLSVSRVSDDKELCRGSIQWRNR